MTFEQYMHDYLDERAMFPQDAEQIIAAVKSHPANDSMTDRWNHQTSDYPPIILGMLNLAINRAAVEWIDANVPLHFARPLFAGAIAS